MNVLAVDVGRTNIRAELAGRRVTVAGGPTLSDADGAERLADLVATCLRELAGAPPDDLTVVVAAAGALGGDDRATHLAQCIATATGATSVVVTGDVVAAHAAAFGGQPGVVLAIGTGTVALTGRPGEWRWIGGEGYLLGDGGGGFAIARAGLLAALRHNDGRTRGSSALAEAAARRFGPLPKMPGLLHVGADPARTIATFAPDVAAAARAGDDVARGIWAGAVDDLVELVDAACAGLPDDARRVALTGGLSAVDDLLADPLRALIARRSPAIEVVPAVADLVAGATALAGEVGLAYESLLITSSAPVDVLLAPQGGTAS